MKHDDTTLQAAIDAAMHETRRNNSCKSFAACKKSWPKSWLKESTARLALAKAFLAKLPEPQPHSTDWKARAEKAEEEVAALKGDMLIAERAVDNVLKILPEMVKSPSWEDAAITIREHIDKLQKELTEVIARAEKAESDAAVNYGMLLAARDHTKKAEAELAAIKSSPIGILRPLSEAGPVPDGCVRVTALKDHKNDWAIGDSQSQHDTHFADIRLPVTETSATKAADPAKEIEAMREALQEAHTTLESIAKAKPSEWGEMSDQFKPWAQNRARHAFTKLKPFIKS